MSMKKKTEKPIKKDTGGAAFPCPKMDGNFPQDGMTLRQWYAGKAMAGALANQKFTDFYDPASITKIAFDFADKMIEFEKNESTPVK
jgi:hypothetical protein